MLILLKTPRFQKRAILASQASSVSPSHLHFFMDGEWAARELHYEKQKVQISRTDTMADLRRANAWRPEVAHLPEQHLGLPSLDFKLSLAAVYERFEPLPSNAMNARRPKKRAERGKC